MAEQQNPTPPAQTVDLSVLPGVRRDGTDFDGDYWQDAQWVRFQRGRPRKMGGLKGQPAFVPGVVTGMHSAVSNSSNGATVVHMGASRNVFPFSGLHVFQSFTDLGSGLVRFLTDRTPALTPPLFSNGPVTDSWQFDVLYSAASSTNQLVALWSSDRDLVYKDVSSAVGLNRVFSGPLNATTPLVEVSDSAGLLSASGLVVLSPFLFVYGEQGLIRNSNANDISAATGWTTGGANKANTNNVGTTKIVRGLPLRGGGQSPAGLFWSLDSLIRVTFVGGAALWNYDVVSTSTNIIGRNAVVEYDNVYYWMGNDRFYMYNGVVQELPNDMNLNWVLDSIDTAKSNFVKAVKVPRYGEIWWLFKTAGSATPFSCDAAVIYNVREKSWYDARLVRESAVPGGATSWRPLMTEATYVEGAPTLEVVDLIRFDPAAVVPPGIPLRAHLATAFPTATPVFGSVSSASGIVMGSPSVIDGTVPVSVTSGTFQIGEFLRVNSPTDLTYAAKEIPVAASTLVIHNVAYTTLWSHEEADPDKLPRDVGRTPILGYCETANLSFVTSTQLSGQNMQYRLHRVEPDFVMSGDMELSVLGKSFAQGAVLTTGPYVFGPATEYIDLREQRREMKLKFSSNVVGGTFQMGKILLTIEPGDERG